jgi:hypothetical protein
LVYGGSQRSEDADVEVEDAAPPGSSENPIHSAEPVALDGIHTVVFLSQLLSDSMRMDHSQLLQTPLLLEIFNGLGSPSILVQTFGTRQLQ